MPKTKLQPVFTEVIKERPASYPLIEKWTQQICADGDDRAEHTAAFLVLLDEIERAEGDHQRIAMIVWSAKRAAYSLSEFADSAMNKLIEEIRSQNKLRLVKMVKQDKKARKSVAKKKSPAKK